MDHIRGVITRQSLNLKIMQKKTEQVLNHPYITKFIVESGEVNPSQLKPFLSKLVQYIRETDNCKSCPGLETCPNLIKGHYPTLQGYNGHLDLIVNKCQKLESAELEKKREKLIQSHHISADIQDATFDNVDSDKERFAAIELALNFCSQYIQNGSVRKGIYFYGGFGVGKTHLGGCIANYLAKYDIPSVMVHTPSLINEMRDAIGDSIRNNKVSGTVSEKIDALSNVPVLIMDDIGMESYTVWIRDNVFGVIPQNRMTKNLPTIYTSNLSLDELEEAMSTIREKGQIYTDNVGAKRVMERIRSRVVPIKVLGRNRRYDD